MVIHMIGTVQRNCPSFAPGYERLRATCGGLAIDGRWAILVPLGDPPTRFCTPASTNRPAFRRWSRSTALRWRALLAICPLAVLDLTRLSPRRSMSTCPVAGSRPASPVATGRAVAKEVPDGTSYPAWFITLQPAQFPNR